MTRMPKGYWVVYVMAAIALWSTFADSDDRTCERVGFGDAWACYDD